MPMEMVPDFGSVTANRLFAQLGYAACAVCADIKPAVLFHVRGEANLTAWGHHGKAFINILGLHVHCLAGDRQNMALIFYRPGHLCEVLERSDSRAFLRGIGYPDGETHKGDLARLSRRYRSGSYPHEIGVFLGYPPHDVMGYIENNGQHWLACRYWKVYDDLEGAIDLFSRIDHCKKAAAAQLLQCVCPS